MSYQVFFKDRPYKFVQEPLNCQSNFWLNAIIFRNKEERDIFLKESNLKGIATRPIWTLLNKLSMFEHCQCGDLTNSEWLEERVINIPSSAINMN